MWKPLTFFNLEEVLQDSLSLVFSSLCLPLPESSVTGLAFHTRIFFRLWKTVFSLLAISIDAFQSGIEDRKRFARRLGLKNGRDMLMYDFNLLDFLTIIFC